MGSRDDSLGLTTAERVKAMMTGKKSADALKSEGSTRTEQDGGTGVAMEQARRALEDWPAAPRGIGEKLLEHYGPPQDMTPTKFFWGRVGPWARMELTAEETLHNFPTPHTDFLAQFVDYPVSGEHASEVVKMDGSVILNRTAGQIGSRCDTEAANILTLNVVVDVLEGRRTVQEGRDFLAENLSAYALGRDAPAAEHLQFTPRRDSADPDEGIIGDAVLDQVTEKFKDAVGKGETARD